MEENKNKGRKQIELFFFFFVGSVNGICSKRRRVSENFERYPLKRRIENLREEFQKPTKP